MNGLRVTPSGPFSAEGEQGGPFSPASQQYTLENVGGSDLSFAVTADAAWLDVTGGSGTIPAGGTTPVTVSINAVAAGLAQGTYTAIVSFVNLTDGVGTTARTANLQVGVPDVVYSFAMDTNPGWTLGTGWGFGTPLGGGGQYGSPDPTAGHTGTNVIGYNLAGDYENNLPMRHVFTTPIDCSDLSAVSLRFWRWLGVESPTYDHAYISVSNDGVNYTPIWSNQAQIADNAWTQVEYDISALADGQSSVTIAWTMGTTDTSWQFCGWNIDDVEILALPAGGGTPVADAPAAGTGLRAATPNPFNSATEVRFELAAAGRARLRCGHARPAGPRPGGCSDASRPAALDLERRGRRRAPGQQWRLPAAARVRRHHRREQGHAGQATSS